MTAPDRLRDYDSHRAAAGLQTRDGHTGEAQIFIVRIVANLLILCLELGAIVGLAALGFYQPFAFAGATFVVALLFGARLEYARLKNELTFYFEGRTPPAGMFTGVVALSEALFKAILAGVVALVTFSGTDQSRLFWVALVFAACVFAGSSGLRWLANRFGISLGRWGYFRIAAPLGLLFSLALTLLVAYAALPVPTVGKIVWETILNTPARPTIAQASELLFLVKLKLDELFLILLRVFLNDRTAAVAAVLTSGNMLTGFIIGLYAIIVAEMVAWFEQRAPG